ncbi:hypothetical protein QYF36_007337 [Acer negundo]|nr:hypothetical protein QYF36_007337 [Acer negundo]
MLARYVQTHGDFIVVGDKMRSISVLMYEVTDEQLLIHFQHEGVIEEQARDYNINSPRQMSSARISTTDITMTN